MAGRGEGEKPTGSKRQILSWTEEEVNISGTGETKVGTKTTYPLQGKTQVGKGKESIREFESKAEK